MRISGLQAATGVVLTASFVVIASVMTFGSNLQRVLTLWGESFQMSVYLAENATPETVSGLTEYLKNNDKIDKLEFVDKDKALKLFQEQMASYAPDLLKDRDLMNVIPESFQFSISSKISPENQLEAMEALSASIKTQNGVEEVSYGQDWIKSYTTLFNGIHGIGLFFIGLIIVSAAFVMSNSIRSAIATRRQEIEVMELIGATKAYIRIPYLREAAVTAFVSCALALGITYGFFEITKDMIKTQLGYLQLSQHIHFLPMTAVIGLLGFATIIGLFSAYLCVKNINTGWAASQKSQA